MKKLLFTLLLTGALSYAQSIERQVIGSTGATLSNGSTTIDFTVGELVVITIADGSTAILTQGFHQGEIQMSINLSATAFLQGALLNPNSGEESLMRDDLRVASRIPTTSPYADGAICSSNVFTVTGNDAIVDWIFIELRDKNTNTNILYGQSALLQRDGDIVGVDGISALSFNAPVDDYYVAIKHRNHLGIMTANSITLSETTSVLNFTDANNQITYGTNAQTSFGIPSGVVAMWGGDANGDGRLNYLGAFTENTVIRTQVMNDPNNSVFGAPPVATYASTGYYDTDIDMDGNTKYLGSSGGVNSDAVYVRNNTFNNPSNSVFGGPPSATYVFIQQLPEGAN